MKVGILAGAVSLLLAACTAPVFLSGPMSGAQEVSARRSAAAGVVTATVYPSIGAMSCKVEYAGLPGPAPAAHFHGPAMPGANAGVLVPFEEAGSPATGTATLTAAQQSDVMAGKWCANVRTAANPGGEIRGQLMPAAAAR